MNQFTPDLSLQQTLVKRSSFQLTCILIISSLSFVGWMFSISWLKHPFSGLVAMNPLTSICFVLLVVALQFKTKQQNSRRKQTAADYISLFVLAITFSKLVSIVFDIDYTLDQLLFANQIKKEIIGGFTNSMAPNTAFCFGLLSISLLFFGKLKRFFLIVSQVANVLALMIAVFSILGYIFGAEEFYEVQDFLPMALSSGICFLLLALSILFALPGVGIMQQLTSTYNGSYIAWRMFVPAFVLPVMIGLFRIWGQRYGLYNLEFGSALSVTSMILIFLALIWLNTMLLNRREQRQEEIIREKDHLANLVEQTSDAILSTDINLNVKSWNKGAEEIYGYKKQEVLGRPLRSFLKSTNSDEETKRRMAELNAKGSYNDEYIFFNKYQQQIFVQAAVSVLRDTDGNVNGYVAIHRDISERKQLEKQLKEFNQQLEIQVKEKTTELREVFERISDAFIGLGNDTRIVYINKRAELLFNIDSSQITDTSIYDLLQTGEGEVEQAIKQAFDSREYIYLETFFTRLGKWFELNIHPSASGLSMYIRDITVRKKALEALNASEEKYRLFFENSMDGILLTDGLGRIFSANKAATEIFGMTEEEICSGGRIGILDETDPNWPEFYSTRDKFGKAKGELYHFRKDRTRFLAEITSVKFKTASGEEQTNTIIRDITERKRAEEDLNESYQQIRRLTAYLHKIREEERAHIAREIHDELGQQLTVMKMDISWMKKKVNNGDVAAVPAKMDDLQKIIDGTVASVRRIATDLRPSLLDDIGLIAAMEWEADSFEKRTGISVRLSKSEEQLAVPDRFSTDLFRILQESLTNITRHASASQVDIHLKNQNNEFILCIEDNGKGFDTNTVAGKKTLGLLGMKERSAMMHGIFEIESKPGSGTKLKVRVPLH